MQKKSFWDELQKPIVGLSPMDGLTDQPFRFIQKKYGKPAIMYTEFTSVEGVCHGATQLLKDFLYDETQRPLIAQIYGTTPDFFRQTAIALCELGFDGIDINMGCPAKNVAHSGAGAALIKNQALAQQIIAATKQGVTDWNNGATPADCPNLRSEIVEEVAKRHAALPPQYQEKRYLPVSVKTRVGFDEPVVEEWMNTLLEMEPAAIALHGRTLKQQYGGLASWELIGQAAAIVHTTTTKILGNGDIADLAMAHERITTYGTDGVLIGRASLGDPYIFTDHQSMATSLYAIAVEHAELFEKIYAGEEKYNFLPMRKHLSWYVKSIPYASEVRSELVRANNAAEVAAIFKKHTLL